MLRQIVTSRNDPTFWALKLQVVVAEVLHAWQCIAGNCHEAELLQQHHVIKRKWPNVEYELLLVIGSTISCVTWPMWGVGALCRP